MSDDERLALFRTPRDWFRHAVSRFNAARLVFGHGTTNPVDEAAFMVLEALHLPVDALEPFADCVLTGEERARLASLIDARVETRKPAAYLLGRTYIQGVRFLADERAIVPRSYLGELLFNGIAGDGGLIASPVDVRSVLDLCTGGGSLAILAAKVFENAQVDAVDLSADALELARANVAEHGLDDRISLYRSDLFASLPRRRYDLILTNPPYVTTSAIANFPPEYAAEPRLAHEGGPDGLDIVRAILALVPGWLERSGWLVCEVGTGRPALEAAYPEVPFLWLDTAESEGEVFAIAAQDLPASRDDAPRRARRKRPGKG